jgi:hypothetical protein
MKSLKKSEDGRMTAAGASSYMVVLSGQSQETNPMGRMDAQTRKPKGNEREGGSYSAWQGAN